jgi:hypothetical protein
MKKLLKRITPLYRLFLLYLKKKQALYNKLTIPDYGYKRKFIIDLARQYHCTDVFVETGTFFGDTIEYVKNDFKSLVSIELNEELSLRAAERFRNNPNVQIVQGDSAKQLSSILSNIGSPVVFWLDGHYSSAFQVGDKYIATSRGEKETPIMDELLQIKNHFVKKHLILIDDARLFNGANDYPALDEVKRFVESQLPEYKFSVRNDIIRILPKTVDE